MGGNASNAAGVWKEPEADTLSDYPELKGDEHHFTVDGTQEAPIRYGKKEPANYDAKTIMEVFKLASEVNGALPSLKVERGAQKEWITWTWKQFYEDTLTFAQACVKLDMKPFSSVAIIGFNSPEWHISDLGAIAAQAKVAGIYTTNGPEACAYIVQHSEAEVVVCEDATQLNKFMAVKKDMPLVKAYVVYNDSAVDLNDAKYQAGAGDKFKCYQWADFMRLGVGADKDELRKEVDRRIAATKPGHCSTLIYTSGTTGRPKAVMISNDNCTWTARVLMDRVPGSYTENERGVSYLPLSHVAAQLNDIYLPIHAAAYGKGSTLFFARPDALKGSLKGTLLACRPTFFFGVPRVWEKFMEGMKKIGETRSDTAKKIAAWAKEKGTKNRDAHQVGGDGSIPWGYTLANKIVYSKVKDNLGLDKCRMFVTGAAPIARETLDYFASLDIIINEVYGMSESTGPQNISVPNYFVQGSVGTALPGCALKLVPYPGMKDGEGEICFRGRHIMMGYLKEKEKTQEAIDKDGWMHSGDIGRVDHTNGMLYITGRIKELIIGAGGENIAPVPVEDAIKAELPGISNVIMIGDKRKYNTCLVTLKQEIDEKTGGFTDKLVAESAAVSADSKTVAEALKDPAWQKYVEDGIKRANKNAVSNASKVQKFRIAPTDFSVVENDLTPTLKLKRSVVTEKYNDLIETMYAEDGAE